MLTDTIPRLGLGTYGRTGKAGLEAILAALEIGYRHLDTAQTYDTEANVGAALMRSGLSRRDVFITTKVAREKLANKDFLPSLYDSLERLGIDRLDLTLIHWPSVDPAVRLEDYLQSLAEAKRRGLTRLIGVSNFPVALLERSVALLGQGEIATNQVEMHPFLQNRKVLDACRAHGIRVTAYMPLAQGRVASDPKLAEIGKAHRATATQAALGWLLKLGVVAIPASSRKEHMLSNFHAAAIRFSDKAMGDIAKLDRGERLIDPPDAPAWD